MSLDNPTASHIYVVGFSGHIVKVGRTSNPRRRMQSLASHAKTERSATLTDQFIAKHENADLAECGMKWVAGRYFERAWGQEYFHGEFDALMEALRADLPLFGVTFSTVIPFDDAALIEGLRRRMAPALTLIT